jgi:hypothetical protein
MLHKDHDRKCSVEKKNSLSVKGLAVETDWRQTASRKVTLTLTLTLTVTLSELVGE